MNLYQVDNKNVIRVWSILAANNEIIIRHGTLDGKMIETRETVTEGLAGRSLLNQVESRVNSRINKQLDKGYKHSIEEAKRNVGRNKVGLVKPMLAVQEDKVKEYDAQGAVYQRKLDGNRMLVTKQDGVLLAYTRNGKPITTLDHILEEVDQLIYEGETVDGEVYIHGMPLKDINSRIRKKQPGTLDLKYHIYDIVDSRPFRERFNPLFTRLPGPMTNVKLEHTWPIEVDQESLFKEVRDDGYEGLMLRLDGYGYQAGKRSKALLKIKIRQDAEAEVIDVEVSKDGTGKLICKMPSGKTFGLVPPGDRVDKILVAKYPDDYIGRQVTYSYAYLTDFGIPFHAVAERYRETDMD